MSPKLRTPGPDPFNEKTKPSNSASPHPLDDETTAPVDMREMEAAARASRFVSDPSSRLAALRPREALSAPYAELRIPGDFRVHELPTHRVSATGLALEVPSGISLIVEEGLTIAVHLHLEGGGVPIRSRARVAHYRAGKDGKAGGLALRWEPESADAASELERISADGKA